MAITIAPTMDEYRPVVFRVLADGQPRPISEIYDLVAQAMDLSDEVMSERLSSGTLRYKNRIAWACSMSTQAGLLARPKRGYYRITPEGLTVDSRNLKSYSEKDMLEWNTWAEFQQEVAERKGRPAASDEVEDNSPEDPVETMSAAESDFNSQTATGLRKRLQESSPEFFEKAVIEVLWAMGYGGTHGEKKHVGRSNDGGIDGVIQQDALGLTNIYIQAKRYSDTNTVTVSALRDFIGALDSKGANLGVFITTSDFTAEARKAANGYRHGRIVLINGQKLTSLMLEYGVAVHKAQEFVLYEIDDDFFDEEVF